jgi:hypothetical protein
MCNVACTHKSIATAEVCDGVDNNCNGHVDEGVANACGGCGTLAHAPNTTCAAGSGECMRTGIYRCDGVDSVSCDAVAATSIAETCDGHDNDCDGSIDEDVGTTWYQDCDGDGYPAQAPAKQACTKPVAAAGCGWTSRAPTVADTDCNDHLEVAHPGAGYSLPITRAGASLPPSGDAAYDLDCDGVPQATLTLSTGKIVGGQLEIIPICDANTACVGTSPLCVPGLSFSGVPTCGVAYMYNSGCSGTISGYFLCK